jgi:hypothetical protein
MRELGRLRFEALRLGLHLVVERLDPQHGLHARHERRLIHRLRQVLVCTGFEPADHVLRFRAGRDEDDRHEWQGGVRLEPPADLEPVELRHHHVEEDQVRMLRAGEAERLLAIGRRQELVAVDSEASLENVDVGWVVVGDEDPRGRSHFKSSRILASRARGLKGLVT